jgi:hypothetical protein
VTINVAQVPRPPTISPQNRSIAEGSPSLSTLSPALFATQPQGLKLNYSVSPSTVFGIGETTGVLFLQAGQSLVYATQSTYSLTAIVISSAGTQASAPLTILVTQINKPPVFNQRVFSLTVNESSPAGTVFGTTLATTTNIPDVLTYSIADVVPAGAWGWFAIDAALATLSVGPTQTRGLLVDTALTYPAGAWTVNVSLLVRNAGGLIANATALVTVTFISPRVLAFPVNATARNNASALTPVTTLLPAIWTPYSPSTLTFSFVSAAMTASGSTAFVVTNPSSGDVAVASFSYPTTVGAFDTQTWMYSTWMALDTATGRSATGGLNVTVLHSNRAPTLSIPKTSETIYAPLATRGPFGISLSQFAADLDLPLGIGEALTFSLVASTNPGGAFAIDPSTAQLSIAIPTAQAVQVTGNNITLTVAVRDAGIDGPVFWAYANVTVSVVFAAHPPTLSTFAFSVPELAAANTFVGNVTGYSLSFSSVMTYTISPASSESTCPFAIASVLSPTAGGPVMVSAVSWGEYAHVACRSCCP